MDKSLRSLIGAMEEELAAGAPVYRPSRFWTRLSDIHERQLSEAGIGSFKRSVNQYYYNWAFGIRDPQVRSLARWLVTHPHISVLSARLTDWQGFQSQAATNPLEDRPRRWLYQLAVATLWEFAAHRDRLGLLEQLQEPELGQPLIVRHRGRHISQDLANSVLEFYAIAEGMGHDRPGGNGVLELGAGYGRLAWVYLSAFPELRYFIVDIPPALAISQEYLTRLFPDRPTFRFRHFDRYSDVADEMRRAQLGFMTPNQLELVPEWNAGLFINVSSLHEMRPDQIDAFASLIDRHTQGTFYTKQWQTWTNPADGVTLSQADYPVLPGWHQRFARTHPVQTAFFEAAYGIGQPPRPTMAPSSAIEAEA